MSDFHCDYENSDPYVYSATNRLPGAFHHLGSELSFPGTHRGGRICRAAARFADLSARCLQRARNIAIILRRERCSGVLGCSGGDGLDIPAAFLAARLTGRPFCAYAFDDYVYQWVDRVQRLFAAIFAQAVFRNSESVIVPNEFLAKEYAKRYGIEPAIIRNCCDATVADSKEMNPWSRNDPEIRIVYTGAIYRAHYDAFRNLVTALRLLEPQNIRLYLYTAQRKEDLDREGISGPVVHKGHLSNEEIRDVQSQAHILFLPLAFSSPCPDVINTSAPGKMAEYLASGRPILVHAPAASFLSWFFKANKCGLVVDRCDAASLAEAVRRLQEDHQLRTKLQTRAAETYLRDFGLGDSQRKFRRIVLSPVSGGVASDPPVPD